MFKRLVSSALLALASPAALAVMPAFGPIESLLPGIPGTAVAIADMDGDGLDDLVFLGAWSNPTYRSKVAIARQNAQGGLDVPVAFDIGYGNNAFGGLALADMDGDGQPDIVVTHFLGTAILRNQGNLAFDLATHPGTVSPEEMRFTDVDGDGHVDIVAVMNPGASYVLFGDGQGRLREQRMLDIPGGRGAQVADIDGDGRPDLAYLGGGFANATGDVLIHYGQANGFSNIPTRVKLRLARSGGDLALSDVDGDGRIDLVVTERETAGHSARLSVHPQLPGGRFGLARQMTVGVVPSTPLLVDIDRNGDDDLVVSHGLGFVGVHRNHGAGFEREVQYPMVSTGRPSQLALGDIDGDRIVDMVAPRLDGFAVIRGRIAPVDADLGVSIGYPTSGKTAVVVSLQNFTNGVATGAVDATIDFDIRKGPYVLQDTPGCDRQPRGTHGTRLHCQFNALASGAHRLIEIPLVVAPYAGNNTVTVRVRASHQGRDPRPHNNASTRRWTLPPPPVPSRR